MLSRKLLHSTTASYLERVSMLHVHDVLLLVFGIATSMLSCQGSSSADGENPQCDGAKCDNAGGDSDGVDLGCGEILQNFSGDGRDTAAILHQDDALAKLLLRSEDLGKSCPLSVSDLAAAIAASDCGSGGTAFVSERSQIDRKLTDYRAITTF